MTVDPPNALAMLFQMALENGILYYDHREKPDRTRIIHMLKLRVAGAHMTLCSFEMSLGDNQNTS